MGADSQRSELYAGIFVLLGIGLFAWLTLRFGDFAREKPGGYSLVLEIPDATGLREGVPVRVRGVDVGEVASEPDLAASLRQLEVDLHIFGDTKIPADSSFFVATSGLMGDSFIRIEPPIDAASPFLQDGQRISATAQGSLTDMTGEAGLALTEVRAAVSEIRSLVGEVDGFLTHLDEGLLTEENTENFRIALAELKATTEEIHRAAKRVDPLLEQSAEMIGKIDTAADSANQAFVDLGDGLQEFNRTLETVTPVVSELDRTLDDLRSTIRTAESLIGRIEHGDGLASALVNDSQLRADLESFVEKLDENGVLFYPREGGLFRPERPREAERPRTGSDTSPAEAEPVKKNPFSWLKKKPER